MHFQAHYWDVNTGDVCKEHYIEMIMQEEHYTSISDTDINAHIHPTSAFLWRNPRTQFSLFNQPVSTRSF